METYFGAPVNSILDYPDVDSFNPYDQDVKVPSNWVPRIVERSPYGGAFRPASGLGELGQTTGLVSTVESYVSNYWWILLAVAIGLYLMWPKKEK